MTAPSPGTPSYNTDESTNLGVLAQQITDLHGHDILHLKAGEEGDATFIVLPQGKTLKDITPELEKYLPAPRRMRGTTSLTTAAAFLKFLERFSKPTETVVFADPTRSAPKLTAIFDYHKVDHTPQFGVHRAEYAPKLSDPWNTWVGNDDTEMPQGDFAEFIEENLPDIIVPHLDDPNLKTFASLVDGTFAEPSQLLELSRGMQVNVNAQVRGAVTLANGAIQVQYAEVHADGEGQPLKVPNLFQIAVPVFEGGAAYVMGARLRYRVADRRVLWRYLLVRPDIVFKAAFDEVVQQVEQEANVPVFHGAPSK